MDSKFNNSNVEALLKIAAGKLNMKPEVLRKQLEEGKFDEALKNMMSNSQAKDMYRKITGKDPE